ncbi:hypothetical protein GLOIN_2v1632380 [Rhizophagus clarus]|uniref:Uncharacterized protein n=1 Tax=Rhizophagus clarus TaxID=94130 RepID=A0A8H3QII2_9GLOM|nr:hypothetical protein GLOIN_2v1632380 [Rhizophagus clarus]
MSNLVSKIENVLLTGPLDAVCGANVVYLAMNGNNLGKYEDVRTLADNAVNSALMKVTDTERRMKVLEILAELIWRSLLKMVIAYKSIKGLRAIKALNTDKEAIQEKTREEIEQNYNTLKSKLSNPKTDSDTSLYDALKKNLVNHIDPGNLSWRDPEANMVLSDKSVLVEKLGQRQKRVFMEPYENIKCTLPESVISKCEQFMCNFNKPNITNMSRNIVHDKTWKENISALEKRAERILSVLGDIWNNPAFENSTTRKEQSEGTYITDVVIPLLRASLEDMPNGNICLSTTAELSKQISKELRRKCSRIIRNDTKKSNDEVKLWRETLDGISFVNLVCRPLNNQFGIVGVQVAGEDIYLNVLVNDAGGLSRYFHIDHAEIPLTVKSPRRVKPLLRLLLTLRNIMIVNKSLLMQALEQAISNPPRNVNPSPTVSTPPYNN